MIPALAAFFPGKLAAIAESLVLEDDPRPHVPGVALLDGDRLRQMLSAFAANYAEPDQQAVATQWSKWHFSQFLPPVLIANIAADWLLPTAIDRIGIVLSPDSRTLAVRLPGEGTRLPVSGAQQRFSPLVEDHLAPLIAAISRASGLPAKTLWSNAGNIAETVVSECAGFLGEAHPGVTDARALLAARLWPDGRRNELFEPVRYREGRRRRLCCLRYRMASLSLCKSCPLDKIPPGSGRSEKDQQGTS